MVANGHRLSDATFAIPVVQSEVRISEVHYNPAEPTSAAELAATDDNNDFEFLEIYNPNPVGSINLEGMQFDNGITFSFGDVDLGPGERAVIVRNLAAFQARYGTSIRVLGMYAGTSLSNSGEQADIGRQPRPSDSRLCVLRYDAVAGCCRW